MKRNSNFDRYKHQERTRTRERAVIQERDIELKLSVPFDTLTFTQMLWKGIEEDIDKNKEIWI